MKSVQSIMERRLRDDAHCSDYMVLLNEFKQDIDSACANQFAHHLSDPRENDVVVKFSGKTYVLPLSFLSELLEIDYFEGLIDNLHRGPDEQVYTWPLDENYTHPLCSGCGECEQKKLAFKLGTTCIHKLVEAEPSERHSKSCGEYFSRKKLED